MLQNVNHIFVTPKTRLFKIEIPKSNYNHIDMFIKTLRLQENVNYCLNFDI